MCDPTETEPGTGWRGWKTSDTSRPGRAAGDWIDLTWPLSPGVPRISSFPPPRVERIASIPENPLNITELSMIVHVDTHVDSPRHDGPALEDMPLAQVANARSVAGRRAEFLFLPLNIVGGDGAPARVLGRAMSD